MLVPYGAPSLANRLTLLGFFFPTTARALLHSQRTIAEAIAPVTDSMVISARALLRRPSYSPQRVAEDATLRLKVLHTAALLAPLLSAAMTCSSFSPSTARG